jgi:hypothetical protein
MTVHDREPEVLLATLRSLHRAGLDESQLVIVDDRSSMDYSWIRDYAAPRFAEVRWQPTGDYEGFRVEGYGNPSRAFNTGLALCTKERLVVMSSDVIVTPKAVKSMLRFGKGDCLFTPKVIDMDTNLDYCGPGRQFPMPWFLSMPTKTAQEVGGWNDDFLGGFCFEDNDFVGRVALKLGLIRMDWSAVTYHQSHLQPAYDTTSDEVMAANARNRDICKRIWGGIPFDGEFPPFRITAKPDPMGCARMEVDNESLKERFFGAKA